MSLIRKILPASILLALFLAKFNLVPTTYFADVTLTATGQTSSQKPGSAVVWLASPGIRELNRLDFKIQKSDGWETKSGLFISTRNQPATLRFSGYLAKPIPLQLIQSPHSGLVDITINGFQTKVDLFSPAQKVLSIETTNHLLETHPSSFFIVAQFLRRFATSFLLLTVFFIALYPIYQRIPQLSIKSSARKTVSASPYESRIFLTALVTLGLLVVTFYPGVMIYDSYEQYWQALHFWFVDWHPPVMALLWSSTDRIIKGSGGMLLLQLASAVYSFFLLSKVAARIGKKKYWMPLFAVFLPFISCSIFFLIKDVSLALSLLLAFSLWYFYRATGKWNWPRMMLILMILFYASAVRKNALPAVIPLLFVFLFDYVPWKKALAWSLLLSLLFYFGNEFLVYRILHADKRHPFQVIMMHDLMGIYAMTKKNYVPQSYLNQTRLDEVIRHYDHRISARTTVWFKDWFISYEDAVISGLKTAWLTSIRENVLAYLSHRWILFKSFLTDLDGKVNHLYAVSDWHDVMLNLPPPLLQETALGKINTAYVNWTYKYLGFLFKGYFWLAVSCLLFGYAIRRKFISVAGLAASSLLYFAPFFFVAPSVNYRYIYWPVIASITSLIVIWIEKDATSIDSSTGLAGIVKADFPQPAVTRNRY